MYDIEFENIEYQEQLDLEHEITLESRAYPHRKIVNNSSNPTGQKRLKRELRAEALTRLEEAARTVDDFKNVTDWWDRLDENRERKERYHEVSRGDNVPLDYNAAEDGQFFPRNLSKSIWKQIQKGDFIDAVYNCPYELHELVTEQYTSKVLKDLSEDNKEILYYIALWQYSTTKIAAIRGQTDRNIRKVRNTMLKRIQKKLYVALTDRQYMTAEEREFISNYIDKANNDR